MSQSTLIANQAYATLASDAQVEHTAQALQANGMTVLIAANGNDAKKVLFEQVLPAGAEVFVSSSTTLNQLGVAEEIDQPDGNYDSVRVKLGKMDRSTQGRDMQKLGATPQYIVGSVHAITENGQAVIASMTGSQLGPYASAAANVVWVVGTQKIVRDLDEALKRVQEYSYPLEDARALKAYGVHSSINKLLIFNREVTPGRVTVILVKENLGF